MEQTSTLNPVPASNGVNFWMAALRTPLALGLAVLLGVQLLAAIGLSLTGRGALAPAPLDSPLLAFDPKAVTAIRIAGGDGKTVTLTRGEQGWLIGDLADFPADGAKADALIDKLAALDRPLPVATSPEALKRHKVADDGYERKVTLEAGDKTVATLIVGDSPGFRRLFARPAGNPEVYDLNLALFDVSNRADDWLARDSLRVGRESIERVSSGDWTLIKGEDGWQLKGSEQHPDQTAVDDLLSRISNLSYRGVLGSEGRPEYDQQSPTLEIEIGLAKGETRKYRISEVKDGQDFVLKASDRPWYFKLSDFDLEGLEGLTRDTFLGKPEPNEAPAVLPPAEAQGEAAPAESPQGKAQEDATTAPVPGTAASPGGKGDSAEQVQPEPAE